MKATTQDEIEKQHKAACDKIKSKKYVSAPMIERGEIPLAWKQRPTVEDPNYDIYLSDNSDDNSDDDDNNNKRQYDIGSCISTRGIVNIQNLSQLIQEGCHDPLSKSHQKLTTEQIQKRTITSKTNLWDHINASQNNVHVTRPSHDTWGIKKITLMFCDDFLKTIYEMPWWHTHTEIRDAIQPILDTLNVSPNRIVRMLLAALPPKVTIPVHHDTGEWVKYTHRVHVPIIVPNPDLILFQCGPSEDMMQRINCIPGHVFEMNNQAKHAVSNCLTKLYRVHLILDYVDTSFQIQHRIQLNPGEILTQTRRSIDRAIDVGKRPTPTYMILGAQKSGTTSVYEYMNQHPLIVRAKRRETHCLDWRWNEKLSTREERTEYCQSYFHTENLRKYPSILTGDSTPSYLLDSYRTIPRLKEVFTWKMKLIVILRDPVKRAKSHYEMVTSLDGTPEQVKTRGKQWVNKSLEEVIEIDFQNMKSVGLIPYWNTQTQTIDGDVFDSFVGSKEEDVAFEDYLKIHVPMNTGSHSLLSRGLYELQLRQWMKEFDHDQFLVLKLEDMSQSFPQMHGNRDCSDVSDESGVQSTMNKVWKFLELPCYKVQDESAKNTRSYQKEIKDETKKVLERFYAPHNQRLESLLGTEWYNPWHVA